MQSPTLSLSKPLELCSFMCIGSRRPHYTQWYNLDGKRQRSVLNFLLGEVESRSGSIYCSEQALQLQILEIA